DEQATMFRSMTAERNLLVLLDNVASADQVRALLDSQAPVVTLVAKSDRRHIERALRTDVDEACAMVRDTVAFLTGEGRRVFLDAEHFFDGYAFDPDCALRVLTAAGEGGADVVVLCDTNGGQLPLQLAETVRKVVERTGLRVGIHCQDDTSCAVANSVAAVQAGATHVQCTANGYGERAGNADLFAVVGNLVTKLGMPVLPTESVAELTRVSHALAEIANIAPDTHQAYVGSSAFAHKAGLHASAIKVDPELYNHIDPGVVGNDMRVLVTEMAGRASLELKGRELGVDLTVLQGEYLAIMGHSGSGKSTLLNVLGCLDVPTSGTYKLDGISVGTLNERQLSLVRNRKIGFVFQSFNLVPRTTALSNVELPLIYAGLRRKDRRKRAMAALEMVGLANRAGHNPHELSGGTVEYPVQVNGKVRSRVVVPADATSIRSELPDAPPQIIDVR
ncbi:ATP-binding cassette domain-containing protein, partial [Kibdelosporangium lantanae]